MAAGDDAFNGAYVYFPASANSSDILGPLRSISYRSSGARADVTGSSDTVGTEVVGVPKLEVTVSVVGGITNDLDVGDKGVLGVHWNDAGTSSDGSVSDQAQVSDVQTDGSMDGEIISQVTFIQHPAA